MARKLPILCLLSIPLALTEVAVTTLGAQQPPELIIRNGLVVTAAGRSEADVRIRSGTIAEIGRNLTGSSGARVIDASGMLVLPGGVDPHVHLTPTRTATTLKGADDYTSASRAALAGGQVLPQVLLVRADHLAGLDEARPARGGTTPRTTCGSTSRVRRFRARASEACGARDNA